ncbi:MAG: FecR domain-containing protein [Saprospiraceae bacterium]|nr:FecR domain-containing protein [Saprospiraceae bacterium]
MSLFKKILLKWSPSSKTELEVLENWKSDYVNQIKSLEELHTNQSMKEKYHAYKEVDKEKAWSVLQAKINKTKTLDTQVRVFGINPWQWAAVFTLLVVSLLVFRSFTNNVEKTEYISTLSQKNIMLDDKSLVTLDLNSVLVKNDFRNTELKGRAFFEISKNPSHPFIIKTSNAEIKVLGTSFFVTAKQEFTEITVVEGRVSVSTLFGSKILEAGNRLMIDYRQMTEKKSKDAYILDWRNNFLTFNNVELLEVLNEVALFYNVELVLPDPVPETSCLIRTKFEKTKLENVLSELSLIANFSYTFQNNKVIIEKMKC